MRKLKNQRGFTLIELVVSIAIIGIIIVPLLGLFTQSTKNNAISRNKTSNGAVAQAVMEYYKSKGAEELNSIINGNTAVTQIIFVEGHEGSDSLLNALISEDVITLAGENTEAFDQVTARSNGVPFDLAVRVVLTEKTENLVQIYVTVWDKLNRLGGEVNLISLKGR